MAPTTSEPFTIVDIHASNTLAPDYTNITSAKVADVDIQIVKSLRELYPELCVTAVPADNAPLVEFAAAGFAAAELDTETESIFRWRGYVQSAHRGGEGGLGDVIFFAKYHYKWAGVDFILYTCSNAGSVIQLQYILKDPDTSKGEHALSNCSAIDALITACAKAFLGKETDFVYVYDNYWYRSRELWEEVQKAGWEDVILDPKMKTALTNVTKAFFDSKEVYKRYGVPWKRGLIFYGPPGNGKTVSIKALMKELSLREKDPIPTLYVKDAPYTYDIGEVFDFARTMSPCMLILEDVETIVTSDTRSYFFNEVDGLANNDGILMVASTNYLDRLDSGLSKRPSRFDRKYNFPLPNSDEREEYAQYWRGKLGKSNPSIDFPKKLCPAIAKITKKFSFAYMQEAFVASLLMLAREEQGEEAVEPIDFDTAEDVEKDDPLDKYKLWRAMKVNVKMLREDLENGDDDEGDGDGGYEDSRIELSNEQSVGRHLRSTQLKWALPERTSRHADTALGQPRRKIPHGSVGERFAPRPIRTENTPHARTMNIGRHDMFGGRLGHPFGSAALAGPSAARSTSRSYRDSLAGGIAGRKSSEPTEAEVKRSGVDKVPVLTETAFETVLW